MARTDSSSVISILGASYNYDNISDLAPFIATASTIIARVIACSTAKGITLTEEELELIERWLAAHAYTQMDQMYTSRSTNGASGSFKGQYGMAFDSTPYGQMAMNLDYSGCLAAINKRQVASCGWLGKPVSEQIPYDQRD